MACSHEKVESAAARRPHHFDVCMECGATRQAIPGSEWHTCSLCCSTPEPAPVQGKA